MFSYKKALLLISIIPMFLATASAETLNLPGINECGINIADQVLPDLNFSMISSFAYCSCGVRLENSPQYLSSVVLPTDPISYILGIRTRIKQA